MAAILWKILFFPISCKEKRILLVDSRTCRTVQDRTYSFLHESTELFLFIPLAKAEQAKYSKLSRHVQKNVFLCHVDLSTPVLANKTQIIKHYKVKFFLVEMPVWSTAYQSVCINTVLLVGKSTVSSKWRRWDCLCSSILLLSTHQTSLCPAHFALLCLFPYFRGRNTGFWINMLQNTAHEYLI